MIYISWPGFALIALAFIVFLVIAEKNKHHTSGKTENNSLTKESDHSIFNKPGGVNDPINPDSMNYIFKRTTDL